jgi:AbrB family looped-hinge helix DNA binding protein
MVDILVVGKDGRVTIPSEIREELRITEEDKVIWVLEGERAYINKV